MSENFNLEIISPDQTLLDSAVKQVAIPAYEGMMTILRDHISLITFLRPGFIEIEANSKTSKFYIEEGTVEFSDNKLLILSPSVSHIDKLTKDKIEKMLEESRNLFQNSETDDKEKYFLSYKINSLQEIN